MLEEFVLLIKDNVTSLFGDESIYWKTNNDDTRYACKISPFCRFMCYKSCLQDDLQMTCKLKSFKVCDIYITSYKFIT
jgi:hypothetical protein